MKIGALAILFLAPFMVFGQEQDCDSLFLLDGLTCNPADSQPFSGTCSTHWPDGTLCWMQSFQDGLASGVWTFRDAKGIIRAVIPYSRGMKDGPCTYLHANAGIKSFGTYIHDQKAGWWSHWDESKHLQVKEHYLNGELDSLVSFHPNGKVKDQTAYSAGRKEGAFIAFNQQGKQVKTGYYASDFAEGLWEEFYSNGNIKRRAVFESGSPRDSVFVYSRHGGIKEIEIWKEGELGSILVYNRRGMLKNRIIYLSDDGMVIEKWRRGKLVKSYEL